jgi:hypothetical protein
MPKGKVLVFSSFSLILPVSPRHPISGSPIILYGSTIGTGDDVKVRFLILILQMILSLDGSTTCF